jgi:RNA polymerase sigma-70 factor, ECF subfamily
MMTFEEIYNAFWQKIFRLCMSYVCDYELAQDIAQETFLTVWQQLPKFRDDANVSTWIFKIASNKCLRQIEKQNKLQTTTFPFDLKEENEDNLETNVLFLYKCISELPETDRIIISLELEDINQSEIALIVGLSESYVRVKIHRIKEKLSKKFIENGYK